MRHQVSAVLLAAGSSQRMGQLKQLLPLGNRTVIEHCIMSLISSGVNDIAVVLGPNGREIWERIAYLPVRVSVNEEPDKGMSGSVAAGQNVMDRDSDGVLVCLADHPLVRPETMSGLIGMHSQEPECIIIPSFENRRGHPTLFPSKLLNEVSSGSSLRDIIRDHSASIRYLNTKDDGILTDMDTMEDYEKVLRRFSESDR